MGGPYSSPLFPSFSRGQIPSGAITQLLFGVPQKVERGKGKNVEEIWREIGVTGLVLSYGTSPAMPVVANPPAIACECHIGREGLFPHLA